MALAALSYAEAVFGFNGVYVIFKLVKNTGLALGLWPPGRFQTFSQISFALSGCRLLFTTALNDS